jgi:serine/threonine-protein kinase
MYTKKEERTMRDEFREKYLPKWENLIKSIFNGNVPQHYEWLTMHDIISILNTIGSSDALNHTFFASGGGLDLISATQSHEKGCIELNLDGMVFVLKPKKLMFEYFPEGDYEWAYFRIVTDSLPDSKVYENLSSNDEELTELSPCYYVERSVWDSNEFNGQSLPSNARVITRILDGDFVIFSKASLYNANHSTYDGRHAKLGIEGFKDHIQDAIKYINEKEHT